MPRLNMSLPHERRKAKLKSLELNLRVKAAETKAKLAEVKNEISAMKPKVKKEI